MSEVKLPPHTVLTTDDCVHWKRHNAATLAPVTTPRYTQDKSGQFWRRQRRDDGKFGWSAVTAAHIEMWAENKLFCKGDKG